MKLRAAALALSLPAAAASDRRRGRDRRDLYSTKQAPFPGSRGGPGVKGRTPGGPPSVLGGPINVLDGPINVLDGDCSSTFSYDYLRTDADVVRETVAKDGATGLQLDLRDTVLAAGTTLRLTGAGGAVDLTAKSLASYLNGWSPVIAGDRVTVELVPDAKAAAKRLTSTVKIGGFKAEGVCAPQAASICGDTDDREQSNDQRQGRMAPGCTAWLISEEVFIWAGHCGSPSESARLHLGEPTSGSAPPNMQFAVDMGTYDGVDGGVGNDWGVGRLLPNSQTGEKAGVANGGKWYDLGDVPGGTDGNSIRITGYGVANVDSFYQKTHVGALVGIGQTSLSYVPDTTGGNSGSPVVHENTGKAIGVHTHGGCHANGGSNTGTRIDQPEFAAKIQDILNGIVPTEAPTPAPTPCPDGGHGLVKVELKTDTYGSETTWSLMDECANNEVGAETGVLASHTVFKESFCVPPSKFSFTINDTYGDGMCCQYGEGYYKIYYQGDLTHEGGDFDSSETKDFGWASCDAPPVVAPTNPPVAPPTNPPVAPPTAPPVAPPTNPPVAPPTAPPVAPPTTPPVAPPTNPPVAPPTNPPVAPPTTLPPPADGVITVDLFQMQFTFTPASACVDAPDGAPAGASPRQCAQACAVLESCDGFVELGDECFLVNGAPDDCSDGSNGMFYERSATMYFDN